jgi:hypothetical protein
MTQVIIDRTRRNHRRNTDPNPLRPARHPRERSGLDVPGVARAFVYKDFVKEK